MTNEEAAARLNIEETKVCLLECSGHRADFSYCDFCEDMEMMDRAIEALEKQVPKKPIEVSRKLDGPYYRCASCGCKTIWYYCPYCGQCADWTDYE